jgi:hypothetical protein
VFDELGRAVVATSELVFASDENNRVATPVLDTAQDEPSAEIT